MPILMIPEISRNAWKSAVKIMKENIAQFNITQLSPMWPLLGQVRIFHKLIRIDIQIFRNFQINPKNQISARTFNNFDWQHIDRRFGGAVCIPSICSASETVPQLIKKIFKGTNLVLAEDYQQEDFCQSKVPFAVNFYGGIGMWENLKVF